jgi:hypothetical protein
LKRRPQAGACYILYSGFPMDSPGNCPIPYHAEEK